MNDMSNLIFKCKFYPHQNNHYNKSFQDILNMFKPTMDYIFCILDPLIVEESAYDFDDVSQLLMERKLGPYLKTYPNFFPEILSCTTKSIRILFFLLGIVGVSEFLNLQYSFLDLRFFF